VLSGIHEALRAQTQRRLNAEIVDLSPQTKQLWYGLTSPEADFRLGSATQPDAVLTAANDSRVLAVIKKNGPRLRKLIKWAERADKSVLGSCPLLVVDDEADQASINTRSDDDPSVINDLIRLLLETFPRSAYVGYTATPFANILIGLRDADDDDLYPRDFIVDLPRPKSYFGAERIFGRNSLPQDPDGLEYEGLDVVRLIPDDEIPQLQPGGRKTRGDFEPTITPSLEEATYYFWLATAARRARGGGVNHSSMLVHTTMYTETQNRFAKPLRWLASEAVRRLDTEDQDFLEKLARQWAREQELMPPSEVGEVEVAFERLAPFLIDVIASTEVVVENSQSARRLSYATPDSIQIVVGGNVLSRGLTLEGLVVSYFLRAAAAYDTILQMGRWFGYRDGYADLPRIWMSRELDGYFADLATVEQEIRNDIARYETEGLTPEQFGPRIRLHPSLSITSDLKMQHAIFAQVSFSGQLVQTILFHHRSPDDVSRNLDAAVSLLRRLGGSSRGETKSGSIVFRDVAAADVQGLIRDYRFHEGARAQSEDVLNGYIKDQNGYGDLRQWTVVFVGKLDAKHQRRIGDAEIGLNERSKLRSSDEGTARLGVVASASDLVADLAVSSLPEGPGALDQILERRAGVPLLLLYFIDRDSQPRISKTRLPLEAIDELVGLALLFPVAAHGTPQTYKTADLSGVEREQFVVEEDIDDEPDAVPA
jgi:hypothetical protein